MKFTIPTSNKRHVQDNKGDYSGTIYQSRNVSLDDDGYIKLAQASYAVMTEDDDADFDAADAMYPMDSQLYVNSDQVFRGDIGVSAFTNTSGDTNSPSPGVENDTVFFNGVAVVSDGTLIKYEGSPGTWTTVSLSFSSSFPIAMSPWEAVNSLAVGNNNTVKFVNSSWAVNGTVLTLPPDYQVSSLASNGQNLYIATRSKSGGEAKMFIIDSIQTGVDAGYGCGSFEMASLRVFKSSVVTINSLGQLLRFTGGGFEEIGSLPIYATDVEWCDANNDYSTVSNRGMAVDGDLVLINLSSITQDGRYRMLPNFPSGIWCYDDRNGSLYHRYSPSYTRIQTVAGTSVTVSAADNTFTLTSGNLNSVVTGMPVVYTDGGGTSIPELLEAREYYVIKTSSTVFKLAETYTDALAGTAVDITGTGSTAQNFYVFLTNDYGWTFYENRSAVAVLNSQQFNSDYAGRVAFTADLGAKQAIATNRAVLNGVSPYLPNRGYFVTPRMESENVEDMFQKIYIKHVPLRADEKIRIKFKATDYADFPIASPEYGVASKWVADWTDTDTFTTTADLSGVEAGDEVEIVAGVGSGHIAHVSSISSNAGTYTVNLDEAFPFAVSGDEFYFVADKWVYLDEITSETPTNAAGFWEGSPGAASKFLQLKVEMRGNGVKVGEVQVLSTTEKYSQVYNQ